MGNPLSALGNYLTTLFQSSNQAPTNPSTPASSGSNPNPPSAPQSVGFVNSAENFLGNPLTQAGLEGYFSAIGTPRKRGLGGTLSNAGLGALQGFSNAEEGRQKAALQSAQVRQSQANVAATQAGIPGIQAQSQMSQLGATQMAGIPQHNAGVAAQLRAAAVTMSPDQAKLTVDLANGIANDSTKPYDYPTLLKSVYMEPLQVQQTLADIAQKKGLTNTYGSTIARNQAETANKAAETAAIPEKLAIEKSKTAAVASPKPKAVSDFDLQKEANREAEAAWKAQWHLPLLGADHDTYITNYTKQWLAEHNGLATASTLSPAAIAEAKTKGITINPDGTATGPDGTPYKYSPD